MKAATSMLRRLRFPFQTLLSVALIISCSLWLFGQQPPSNSVNAQREAMRRLSFLAGRWSGPVTITRGMGEPLHLTQSEHVEYKLDGLVLLVQGKSTAADGKVLFNALATIAYDDRSGTYRFRAYNEGHYVDTELSVPDHGFSWSFNAGPAQIVNTMHLTEKGEWDEITEVSMGSNPPHRSTEMFLQHLP